MLGSLLGILALSLAVLTTAQAQMQASVADNSAQIISAKLSTTRFISGLFWVSDTGSFHRRCAATIVTETILLTSASCAQSDYPLKQYGPGSWVIVSGTDSRFEPEPTNITTSNLVENIQMDITTNLAFIRLKDPLKFDSTVMPVVLNSLATVPLETVLTTFNTLEAYGNPMLTITQGNQESCKLMLPDHQQMGLLCTQPVQEQSLLVDYLGGDPIIAFSEQPSAPLAVLVGITGLYYSTVAEARVGIVNDPTAYRFSGLIAPNVDIVAGIAGVDAKTISSSGNLY
ncbi:hypothetical protein GGF37_003879 [Kickxella alabastrina]|nr:hypothetical protein GGF37_003879 [Kickxella alabastrina]